MGGVSSKVSKEAAMQAASKASIAVPKSAASVVVVRPDGDDTLGYRVLMMKRTKTMKFMPNAYVFPGGAVDKKDIAMAEEADQYRRVDIHNIAAHRIAAMRELAEEVGLTFDERGTAWSTKYKQFTPEGVAHLTPFTRWVTPEAEPKRFDTFFFLLMLRPGACAPGVPDDLTLDPKEVADARWIRPADALELHEKKDSGFRLPPPQYLMLHRMNEFPTGPSLMHAYDAYKSAIHAMPRVEPIIQMNDGEVHMHVHEGALHLPTGQYEIPVGVGKDIENPDAAMKLHVGSPLFKRLPNIAKDPNIMFVPRTKE